MKGKLGDWLSRVKAWLTKRKILAIASVLVVAGGLVGFGFGVYSFSENYSTIYNYPEDKGGNFDCSSYDIWDKNYGICLSDDAYFYYNRWAVTDHDLSNPDGVIDITKGWSDYGYDKKAYVTFKWHFEGLHPRSDSRLRIVQELGLASRVFYDDGCTGSPTLFYSWGTPSKTDAMQYPGIYDWDERYFSPTKDTLDIYVELSLSNFGGFSGYGLWVQNFNEDSGRVYGAASAIAVLLMVVLALSLLTSSKDKQLAMPFSLLSLSLAVLYFFTDFIWALGPTLNVFIPQYIVYAGNYLGLILVFSSLIYFFSKQKSKPTKIDYIFFFSSIAASIILYVIFFMTHFAYIAAIPILLYSLHSIYHFMVRTTWSNKWAEVLVSLIFIVFLFLFLFDMIGESNILNFNISGFPSMALVPIAIASTFFYWIIVKDYREKKEESERKETEYQKAKASLLANNINPHFLFNSLTMVQGSYHSSLNQGDKAISLLSKNLRASIDATNKPLIPIDDEMDHISDFVDLYNMRSGGEIEALFDIGYEDFMVPPLSLEVFAENSIKHARLGETKPGYIIIKTSLIGKEIIVSIEDNGCGFDPSKVDASCHTGIHNSIVRLEMTLGAKTTITSKIGEGTKVEIRFNKREEESISK